MISRYGQAALAGELGKLAGVGEGGRNEQLFRSAAALFELVAGGELSESDVTGILARWASLAGLPDGEVKATLKSARRRAGTARRGNSRAHPLERRPQPAAQRPAVEDAPGEAWQRAAMSAALAAADYLHSDRPGAAGARQYLAGRGLTAETIQRAGLGYNPAWRQIDGAGWLAPGITIPATADGRLWYVNVRVTAAARKEAERSGKAIGKYHALPGSKLKALYRADALLAAKTAVICEGEFDALLLGQALPAGWAAVTMGSAGTLPDSATWLRYFAAIDRALLVMDNDQAGQTAVSKWRSLLAWVDLLPVPDGFKDVTDYWQSGGNLALAAWVGVEAPQPQPAASDDQARLVIFPADTNLPFPAGTWERLPDGSIAARLTMAGLKVIKAWRDMLAGDDTIPDSVLLGATL